MEESTNQKSRKIRTRNLQIHLQPKKKKKESKEHLSSNIQQWIQWRYARFCTVNHSRPILWKQVAIAGVRCQHSILEGLQEWPLLQPSKADQWLFQMWNKALLLILELLIRLKEMESKLWFNVFHFFSYYISLIFLFFDILVVLNCEIL